MCSKSVVYGTQRLKGGKEQVKVQRAVPSRARGLRATSCLGEKHGHSQNRRYFKSRKFHLEHQ